MEIGPILRAMRHNVVKVGLLVVEIAVTVTIVLNCLGMLVDLRSKLSQPTGLDEDNIIALESENFGADTQEQSFREQLVDRDLEAIRAMSGVQSASVIRPFPLQGGGSSFQARPMHAGDDAWVRSPVYRADEHFLDTLGLELVAGRAFTRDDFPVGQGGQILNIIVTQDLADALYPDGDALGKAVDTGSEEFPDVIVGIVRHMYTPYGSGGPMETRITFYPGQVAARTGTRFLVRAEPGQRNAVMTALEERVLAVYGDRTLRVQTMLDVKGRGQLQNQIVARILSVLMLLLLFVTGLGIFGVTSFAVTQRRRQIGTRRALGADRWAIVRYFLVENSAVALFGIALGSVGAVALNVALVKNVEGAPLSLAMIVAGAILVWAVGALATIVPALRAAAIAPALATRSS